LLDQFKLNIGRIRQGDRHVTAIEMLLTLAKRCDRKLFRVKPRSDATHVDPVLDRGLDTANDNSNLTHFAE